MIGKARLVSASPFRASVKLDKNQNLNQDSDEEDGFEREELPELLKTRESPIKDDSQLLRNTKTEFLTNFDANQRNDDTMTNRSERTPKIGSGDLKGIMIHETRSNYQHY